MEALRHRAAAAAAAAAAIEATAGSLFPSRAAGAAAASLRRPRQQQQERPPPPHGLSTLPASKRFHTMGIRTRVTLVERCQQVLEASESRMRPQEPDGPITSFSETRDAALVSGGCPSRGWGSGGFDRSSWAAGVCSAVQCILMGQFGHHSDAPEDPKSRWI
jgi:hypothetical protein